MRTIHKYPVPLEKELFSIEMPGGAEVLCFQVQHWEPFVWARVDTKRPMVPRKFRLAGTGLDLGTKQDAMLYVGTVQLAGGSLVLHLFLVNASN